MPRATLSDAFLFHYRLLGRDLPEPQTEYRFVMHAVGGKRGLRAKLKARGLHDFRFDVAWPEKQVAIELDGGVWTRGRHVRPVGFESDAAKFNLAQEWGWTVLRYTTDMLNNDPAGTFAQIRRVLASKEPR